MIMKKVIIFIHIYYASQRGILIEHLQRIRSYAFSIVLTVDPGNRDAFTLVHEIASEFDVLRIVYCPNLGMDVMPFMRALNAIGDEINAYDIAIKFHTKNTFSQRSIDINSIYYKYLFNDALLVQGVDVLGGQLDDLSLSLFMLN